MVKKFFFFFWIMIFLAFVVIGPSVIAGVSMGGHY